MRKTDSGVGYKKLTLNGLVDSNHKTKLYLGDSSKQFKPKRREVNPGGFDKAQGPPELWRVITGILSQTPADAITANQEQSSEGGFPKFPQHLLQCLL